MQDLDRYQKTAEAGKRAFIHSLLACLLMNAAARSRPCTFAKSFAGRTIYDYGSLGRDMVTGNRLQSVSPLLDEKFPSQVPGSLKGAAPSKVLSGNCPTNALWSA